MVLKIINYIENQINILNVKATFELRLNQNDK